MPDYEKIAEEITGLEEPGVEIPVEKLGEASRTFYPVDHAKYQGIASARGYDQSQQRLLRVHYSHDAMIDVIIAEPAITQNELAKRFNRGVPWISRIMGSDAFQAALAKRREDIIDPFLIATVEERLEGVVKQSLDIIADKLELTKNADLALSALTVGVKALGFGARTAPNQQTNNFVVQLPPKSANAGDWAQAHAPMKQLPTGTDG